MSGTAATYFNSAPPGPGGGYPPQQYQMEPPKYGQQLPPQSDWSHGAPPNGNYGYIPPDNMGDKKTFDQTFKIERPKYNDVWAGIFFILVVLTLIGMSAYTINSYAHAGNITRLHKPDFQHHVIGLFAIVLIVAVALSYIYLWLARLFTKQFIWITGILNIILGFVTALYMLSKKNWAGGIIFLMFAGFTVICFMSWIKRIPFSVLMLQTSVDVSKRYGHVYFISWLGGILGAVVGAWYAVLVAAIYTRFEPSANPQCAKGLKNCSTASFVVLLVLVSLGMAWISEWIKGMIHTVIAGIYGSWYFCSKNMPKGITRGALRRAMTYSFGSICFGSMVVAVVNFFRQLCAVAQQTAAQDGNIISCVCFCLLGCMIDTLNWLIQIFNRFAFSHIALYGKSYIQAARDTWKMIKNRGIDALVNECLIGPVFTMGSVFVGYTCALIAFLFVNLTKPSYNRNGSYTGTAIGFSFLFGLQICHIVTTPICSGIETIFVAMAWDPHVMQRDHPDLWAQMISVYPHIQQAIHV